MITNIEEVVREYLSDVAHLSLATIANGMPWMCEVHYAYDDHLNLYFVSRASRRHSQEIAENGIVVGSIVKQFSAKDKVRGVFFEGSARLMEDVKEDHIAYKLFCGRFGEDESLLENGNSHDPRRFYCITVKKFYLFDSIESSSGQKYELIWNGGHPDASLRKGK